MITHFMAVLFVESRGLKKPKNDEFVCFLVRPPSVRFLHAVLFDPKTRVGRKDLFLQSFSSKFQKNLYYVFVRVLNINRYHFKLP